MKPAHSGSLTPQLALLGIVALACVCWGLALNGGFQGYDDLHYFKAAQNWALNGPSLPTEHWSGRLPYVLLLAASIKVFGANSAALVVVNTILLVLVIGIAWWIASLKFDPRSAIFAALLVAITPLCFRSTQTFYPESLEVSLFGIELGLVILALRAEASRQRIALLLVAAGLLGGTALVLRATSVVVPLSVTVFILLETRSIRTTFAMLIPLVGGYVLPLIFEALYYYAMTGYPFYRYMVDGKDGVVNPEMVGETIIGRDALLNFHLARLWSNWAPAVFRTNWTISHLVNLFATPALGLTPYFGLAGVIYCLRSNKAKNLALLAICMLALQYLLFTFVFTLSPTPRYYAKTVMLFCVLGGAPFANLSLPVRTVLLSAQIAFGIVIGLTQISPRSVVAALEVDHQKASPLYISSSIADAAYIAFTRDPGLAESVRVGFPPVGGIALVGWDGWPRDALKRVCDDGAPQWKVLSSTANPSVPWRVMESVLPKLASALPERIAGYLRRDPESTALAQRHC